MQQEQVGRHADTAIIVTVYNPDLGEFLGNLRSYVNQVELVVIFDNSTLDLSRQLLAEGVSDYPNVALISAGDNYGIAHAQNQSVKLAVSRGCSYFIEMDQDSALPVDYVARMRVAYDDAMARYGKIGGVGPIAIRQYDGAIYHGYERGHGLLKVPYTLSSGFMFSLQAWALVGEKDENLFIDFVDWEWCWRCQALGLSTFVNTDVEIQHMLGTGHQRVLGLDIGVPAPIRHYYQYRNSLYLMLKTHVPFRWKCKRLAIYLLKFPLYFFLFGQNAQRRLFMIKGIRDALKGRTGKIPD